MKLIEQSFEIIPQESGIEGIYKQIEKAGRTCYKSEDKITEDSAKKFVDMLTTNCHGAMLEHGTVYLKLPAQGLLTQIAKHSYIDYEHNKYSKTRIVLEETMYPEKHLKINKNEEILIPGLCWCYVTTNMRVLVENNWLDDLKYLCEPTEYHEKRITIKFTTDQGILREFTRHRTMSFAVESTRYCNYSKNKFNNEVTYILPSWINREILPKSLMHNSLDDWGLLMNEYYYNYTEKAHIEWSIPDNETLNIRNFIYSLAAAEQIYLTLIQQGWKPQQARNVLPLATKCDMVMTGFVSDWNHFFELRCDTAAHPQARELAVPLQNWFKENNLID